MGFNSGFKGLIWKCLNKHHHHVQEGLSLIPVPCFLKMKLVPPSLPRSSYVSSSFGLYCSACLGILSKQTDKKKIASHQKYSHLVSAVESLGGPCEMLPHCIHSRGTVMTLIRKYPFRISVSTHRVLFSDLPSCVSSSKK